MAIAPHAHAGGDLIAEHRPEKAEKERARDESHPPPRGGFAFDDGGDLVRNPTDAAVIPNERDPLQLCRRRLQFKAGYSVSHQCSPFRSTVGSACPAPAG